MMFEKACITIFSKGEWWDFVPTVWSIAFNHFASFTRWTSWRVRFNI